MIECVELTDDQKDAIIYNLSKFGLPLNNRKVLDRMRKAIDEALFYKKLKELSKSKVQEFRDQYSSDMTDDQVFEDLNNHMQKKHPDYQGG